MIVRMLILGLVLAFSGCKETARTAPEGAVKVHQPTAPVTPPNPAVTPTPATTPTAEAPKGGSHQFYGVYIHGQKAGWAEEKMTPRPDGGTTLSMYVELTIKRMGAPLLMSITDEVEFGPLPDGNMERFELKESHGKDSAIRRGVVKDGKLHVEVISAGATQKQELELPKETAHHTLPKLLLSTLEEGKPTQTWLYDRQMLRNLPLETTLLSKKETMISGVPTTVLEVRQLDKTRGIDTRNRVTAAGRALESQVGPSMKLVLEDEAMAKNPSLQVPDLYRLSVVRVDKPLGDPGRLSYLKVRFVGLPDFGVSLEDARQSRDGDVLVIKRLVHEALPKVEVSEADRKKWLEPTPFIDHESKVVHTAAKAMAKGDTTAEKVMAMSRALHRKLTYTLETAPLTASGILEGGRGDCTEYARALTAMARSLGYPAREVSGMAYAGDSDPGFAFHAWVEVLVDGRWLAVDPTWDQAPVDATHIALSRDDPSAIVGMLGGLKAEIIEAR